MLQLQKQSSQEGGQKMKMIYYEHRCTRSKGPFSSVKPCAIDVSRPSLGHGKSPCFSRWGFLTHVDVDYVGSGFAVFNIAVIRECTFLHGN